MGDLVDQVTPLLWHTARSQGADPATVEVMAIVCDWMYPVKPVLAVPMGAVGWAPANTTACAEQGPDPLCEAVTVIVRAVGA